MKKEEGKINLLTIILIPVLIGALVLVGYLVFSNNLISKKNISNNDTNEKISETITEDSGFDKVEGIFYPDFKDPFDKTYYVFYLDGRVSYEENYYTRDTHEIMNKTSKKGTYTIENKIIKIKYDTVSRLDTKGEMKTNEEEELILSNVNTIKEYTHLDLKKCIVGKWRYRNAYDKDNNTVPLTEIFGSEAEKRFVAAVVFNDDGTYTNIAGAFSSENDDDTEGTYDVSGNEITLNTKSGKIVLEYYYTSGQICYKYDDYSIWLEVLNDKIVID